MTLRFLNNITITNDLSDFIEDVSVVYAESTKNRPFFGKKVNVERLENIAWTRTVEISQIKIKSHEKVSGKTIYFGENYGYWQLYFKYQGQPYKLENPGCELTLSSSCHEKDLEIRIMENENSKLSALFTINNQREEFTVKNEAAVNQGVTVSIKNELDGDIKNLNLTFSEALTQKNDFFEEFATGIDFDDWKIKSKRSIKSVKEIKFSNSIGNHIWKLHFVYAGFCYELNISNNARMNLTSSDHGTTVEILIFQESGRENVTVKFKFVGREYSNTADKTCSLDKKTEDIKMKANSLNRFVRKTFKNSLKNLMDSMKPLNKFYKTIIHSDEGSSTKSVQQCVETLTQVETVKFEDKELFVVSHFITESKGKIKDDLGEIVKDLKILQNIWNEIQPDINELKSMLMDVINIRFLDKSGYNRNIDSDIKTISNDLMRLISLITVKMLSQVLQISGCNEIGLVFVISKCPTMKKIVYKLEELSTTLKVELEICKQLCFNMDEDVKSPKAAVCNKETLEKSFERGLELFEIVRFELVERLFATASELHLKNRNVNITMITASATAVAGAGAIIAGIIAAPFTAGLSLGLTATGIGMTGAGGATGLITGIVDSALTSSFLNSTVDLVSTDQSLSNLLSTLQILLLRESTNGVSEDDKAEQSACKKAELDENLTHIFSNVGVRVAKIGSQVSRLVGLRIIGIAPGLAFDITSLVFNSINLAKGGYCELGYKLEMQAVQLRESIENLKLQLENSC